MSAIFFEQVELAIANHQSLLVVGLDPNPEMLPARYRPSRESLSTPERLNVLRAWLLEIIEQTCDSVCAYKPTLGFYQALGPQGLELLQTTLAAIPDSIPVILDAKHGDLNTSTPFAQIAFDQWQVGAVTINPYAGQDQVTPFLVHAGKTVFVVCCTSNPSAPALQTFPSLDEPLYLHLVREARTWGTPEQIALEVGTARPEVLGKIRAIAPERLILLRSLWQEGTNLDQMLTAGLDANGSGLLIPVPQDTLSQPDLSQSIRHLQQHINRRREQHITQHSQCDVWISNVCTLQNHPHQDLILQLYDVGCILFGDFVQASGATFPYYVDLRKIISNPQLFQQVLNAYADILKGLTFDRIAGIPYGSLPTATGLALMFDQPMIFPRKEVKAHGTRRLIEGNFHPGETVVVVDDILISGNSAMEGAAKIESAGLQVRDIVVFLDHGGGVKDRLRHHGYTPHSVLTLAEVTETLYQTGRLTEDQYRAIAHTPDPSAAP